METKTRPYMLVSYEDDGVSVYKCLTCQNKWAARWGKWNFCPHCGIKITLKERELSKRKLRIAEAWKTHPKQRGWGTEPESYYLDCMNWHSEKCHFKKGNIHEVVIRGWEPESDMWGQDKSNIQDWEIIRSFNFNHLVRFRGWFRLVKDEMENLRTNSYKRHENYEFKIQIVYDTPEDETVA